MTRILWIDEDNFNLLAGGQSESLDKFLEEKTEEIEYRVAYDALSMDQKKMLVSIPGNFSIYASPRARPPEPLKSRVIKEEFHEKKDIIELIKTIIKEKDRDIVHQMLVEYDIHPIVLSLWLFESFKDNKDALDQLLYLERYIYNKDAYYVLIAANFKGGMPGVKFGFPRKLR